MSVRKIPPFFAIVATTLGVACLGAKSDPSQFYVLQPAASEETIRSDDPLAIGLGPIGIPAYLDRREIVTRLGPHQLEFSEFERWAQPLEEDVARTLAQNLRIYLNTDRIHTYPWYRTIPIDYAVTITLERFERNPTGGAELWGEWAIRDPANDTELSGGSVRMVEPISGSGMGESVAALSRALDRLSREIAGAVGRIRPGDSR